MGYLVDLVNETLNSAALTPQAITGTTQGSALDYSNAELSTNALLTGGAVSGSGASLNIQIEESADQTTWALIPGMAFTAVTTSTNHQVVRGLRTHRYVRANAITVAGTTPSLTVAVEIIAQKKYTGTGGGYSRSPSS